MGFINRMDRSMVNYRIGIWMKNWWWSTIVWMVDVALQGAWKVHHVNKDEGDESLPFQVFRRHCQCNFSKIFKGRYIILKPCRDSKYPIRYLLWWHKALPGAIWTEVYSEPLQTSKIECFCVNSQHLKVVNWICKNTPS